MDEVDIAQQINERLQSDALTAFHRKFQGVGVSLTHCEDCGEDIPEARRRAMPGCTRCIDCQTGFERSRA